MQADTASFCECSVCAACVGEIGQCRIHGIGRTRQLRFPAVESLKSRRQHHSQGPLQHSTSSSAGESRLQSTQPLRQPLLPPRYAAAPQHSRLPSERTAGPCNATAIAASAHNAYAAAAFLAMRAASRRPTPQVSRFFFFRSFHILRERVFFVPRLMRSKLQGQTGEANETRGC